MIGRTVNNYEIQSLIGEGGMGAVYLARHPVIGRNAAIKVLRKEMAQSPGLVTRFVNEARAVNALRHPNLIDIIDAGTMDDGTPYLMMEFLEGESLATRLERQGRIPLADALEIVNQVAEALEAVHRKDIVHRDLKPDNLFLLADDKYPRGLKVKILDFGIAKLLGEQTHSPKTQTGMVIGTPAYMSPEQCKGVAGGIDRRSDVYALGVILFHMVCGRVPFEAEGTGEILGMHIYETVPSPLKFAPDLPAELVALIMKALEKDPQNRFQTMAEMRLPLGKLQRALPSATNTLVTGSTLVSAGGAAGVRPVMPDTTLSASPSVQNGPASDGRSPGRRRGMLVGAAMAVLAAGLGIAIVARDKTAPASAPPPVREPAPVVQPAIVVPPAPPAQPAPAEIELEVMTTPTGAKVFETSKDGRQLGTTPFKVSFKQSDTSLKLWIERAGFRPHEESVSLRESRTVNVVLEKSKPKATPRVDPNESRKI
jgi:eukaryotic-like serine/threonine-protein kinase